jgi:protein-S-isoprenylcysteine O-methyltransferase Ste14
LMVLRRNAKRMDGRLLVRAMTAVSLACPLLMRPASVPGVFTETITACVAAAGLCIVIAGKMSLGRSFGLLPADRGIVIAGVYRVVRHPIYLGYFFTHIAFLLAHPTLANLAAAVTADLTLIVRAELEERTLAGDVSYDRYRARVKWRLVPGLY